MINLNHIYIIPNPLSATTLVVWDVLRFSHVKIKNALSMPPIIDSVIDNIYSAKLCLIFPGIVILLNNYDKLNSPRIHPTRITPAARSFLTLL